MIIEQNNCLETKGVRDDKDLFATSAAEVDTNRVKLIVVNKDCMLIANFKLFLRLWRWDLICVHVNLEALDVSGVTQIHLGSEQHEIV